MNSSASTPRSGKKVSRVRGSRKKFMGSTSVKITGRRSKVGDPMLVGFK
jgi:hypothetical protein